MRNQPCFSCGSSVLFVSLLAGVAAGGAPAVSQPNVILILADDLGAAELGCYGNREHKTPNLDRMAAEGLRLDTFYSTPLCTPTRVCTMTGQYGFRNGYLGMGKEAFKPPKDSPQREIGNHFTIGDLMKSARYATALVGKWQLPGKLPTLIHDCGFDEYRMWAYKENLPEGVEHTGGWEGGKVGGKPERYWNPCIVENGKYLPTRPDDYGPDLFMDFILDFARRHKEGPFFVYHTSVLTHAPHEETPDPGHPGKRWPSGFKSNLEYLDHLMGRLRKGLEDMKLVESTVVIFVGDNGTGNRGKGTVTESGVRVPFIVWGPGQIRPVKEAVAALGDLTDIMPTLAGLSGAELPNDRVFDGKSMVPLLKGKAARHRDWIYSFLDDGRILRSDRWLLEIPGQGKPERFFDCGQCRDGSAYKHVTQLDSAETKAARERFAQILGAMPEPKPRPGVVDAERVRPRQRNRN
ncbi:MAG: sulfatase-like hydrolase/transferase [Phycisphaerae bacterium]|nr:sulfatase-like hydrolase/transferase [Phycisphaerae bacterium]